MMRLKIGVLHVSVLAAFSMGISGCSAIKESVASQMEVPTLEKQVNRVAIGMDIVRENNVMAMKMKISGDATWPQAIAADLNSTHEKVLAAIIKNDPYYRTIHYSEPIQRKILGGSAVTNNLNKSLGFDVGALAGAVADSISPLTYRAAQKAEVLYGPDPKNWPDLYSFDGGLTNFLDFKSGNLQLVEAGSTDIYDTLTQALIALTPVNFQKDLTLAKSDLDNAQDAAASLEGQKTSLQGELKKGGTNQYYINRQLQDIEIQLQQANSVADEKEKIYFTMLDSAVNALKSDIRLSDDQIKLARNVNIASKEIESGAKEAYAAFGVVLLNVGAQPVLKNFPRELESLVFAAARFPRFADQFRARIERLTKNALYFLPNLGMGTYYAYKQSSLAGKYEEISSIIVEAADAKEKADKAAAREKS